MLGIPEREFHARAACRRAGEAWPPISKPSEVAPDWDRPRVRPEVQDKSPEGVVLRQLRILELNELNARDLGPFDTTDSAFEPTGIKP